MFSLSPPHPLFHPFCFRSPFLLLPSLNPDRWSLDLEQNPSLEHVLVHFCRKNCDCRQRFWLYVFMQLSAFFVHITKKCYNFYLFLKSMEPATCIPPLFKCWCLDRPCEGTLWGLYVGMPRFTHSQYFYLYLQCGSSDAACGYQYCSHLFILLWRCGTQWWTQWSGARRRSW